MVPDGAAPAAGAPPPAVETVRVREHHSTMLERFGVVARLLIRLAFRQVRVRPEAVERIRQLATQGTVIYVMRYRSAIDYLLVNALLLREGLPLARFAPGVSTVWWRPFGEWVRRVFRRRPTDAADHATCAALVARGEPVLLFMRSYAAAARRRRALAAARIGVRYLRDVVRGAEAAGQPAFLVPVAVFRGAGLRRRESRFTTLI